MHTTYQSAQREIEEAINEGYSRECAFMIEKLWLREEDAGR